MKPEGHKRVAEEAGIPRLIKALGVSEKELTAFYLGNWLADHSQFKDPHGVIAKISNGPELILSLQEASKNIHSKIKKGILMVLYDLKNNKKIDETAIKELENFIISRIDFSHKTFIEEMQTLRKNSIFNSVFNTEKANEIVEEIIRFEAYLKFVNPNKNDDTFKLNPDTFHEIFERHYTQYYPHEHIDRPPIRHTLNSHTTNLENKINNNKEYPDVVNNDLNLYTYLEDAIKVAVGELHRIEKDWASIFLKAPRSDPERNWEKGLSDLGRVLHLIEDFFAHSNFIENVILSQNQNDIYTIFFKNDEIDKAIKNGTISESEYVVLYKVFDLATKLRKKVLTYEPEIDEKYTNPESIQKDNNIYTGYFDEWDTFISVTETLIDKFVGEDLSYREIIADLASDIANSTIEKFFEDEKELEKAISELRLNDKKTKNTIEKYLDDLPDKKSSKLKKEHATVIEFYCSFIRQIWKSLVIIYSTYHIVTKRVAPLIGIVIDPNPISKMVKVNAFSLGEFNKLLSILISESIKKTVFKGISIASQETVVSLKKAFLTDSDKKNRIGSHSLLAKDLPEEPLYSEMFNCAKFVHWVIINAVCRWGDKAWTNLNSQEEWIDWEDLLFHFIRHPRKAGLVTEITEKIIVSTTTHIVTDENQNMETIWKSKVNDKQYFTYEYFLMLNGIEVPFVNDPIGGTNFDKNKLRNWLILSERAVADGPDNYKLIKGSKIHIPSFHKYLADTVVNTWYEKIIDKDPDDFNNLLLKLLTETPYKKLEGIYEYKYISSAIADERIKKYGKIRNKLEEAYNNK